MLSLNLVGRAPVFVETLKLIRRIAASEATVLIQGETGTGKELAARAIHYLGSCRDHPFIPVNCGAIPDHLIENELFGHARGAYTDARESAHGVLAEADGGTLFLDEIEALSAKAQVALLRFLQDGAYRPLGSRQVVNVKTRIIAASNIHLRQLVRDGKFRADFMYRLQLLTVDMPPLRERPGDIEQLARHFLRILAAQYHQPRKQLDAQSIEALQRHRWPGNVRELENLIHREFLLAEDDVIRIRNLDGTARSAVPPEPKDAAGVRFSQGFAPAKARTIAEFERAYLSWALTQSGGNVSAAARASGKERRAFGKLIKKHGLDRDRYGN